MGEHRSLHSSLLHPRRHRRRRRPSATLDARPQIARTQGLPEGRRTVGRTGGRRPGGCAETGTRVDGGGVAPVSSCKHANRPQEPPTINDMDNKRRPRHAREINRKRRGTHARVEHARVRPLCFIHHPDPRSASLIIVRVVLIIAASGPVVASFDFNPRTGHSALDAVHSGLSAPPTALPNWTHTVDLDDDEGRGRATKVGQGEGMLLDDRHCPRDDGRRRRLATPHFHPRTH